MNEDMDIVVFQDEEGNEIEYEIQFTFEHQGEDYAVLSEVMDQEPAEDEAPELYILKIVMNGDQEEFIAVDEDKMDELIEVVESIFAGELDGEGCGGDCCCCSGCGEEH